MKRCVFPLFVLLIAFTIAACSGKSMLDDAENKDDDPVIDISEEQPSETPVEYKDYSFLFYDNNARKNARGLGSRYTVVGDNATEFRTYNIPEELKLYGFVDNGDLDWIDSTIDPIARERVRAQTEAVETCDQRAINPSRFGDVVCFVGDETGSLVLTLYGYSQPSMIFDPYYTLTLGVRNQMERDITVSIDNIEVNGWSIPNMHRRIESIEHDDPKEHTIEITWEPIALANANIEAISELELCCWYQVEGSDERIPFRFVINPFGDEYTYEEFRRPSDALKIADNDYFTAWLFDTKGIEDLGFQASIYVESKNFLYPTEDDSTISARFYMRLTQENLQNNGFGSIREMYPNSRYLLSGRFPNITYYSDSEDLAYAVAISSTYINKGNTEHIGMSVTELINKNAKKEQSENICDLTAEDV